jgi:uncharacterized membrane protein
MIERLKNNLFFIPMVFVASAMLLAFAGVRLDDALGGDGARFFFVVDSTVDSARAVLSTVAAATITVAGIAFSIALLVFQMASSEYSPRVIAGLFRDDFNKVVMGLVVGTFTYCLLVLQSVRGPLEEDGSEQVPALSVSVGVLLGVISVLAIVAFIDHNARMMDVSQILQRITAATRARADESWIRPDRGAAALAGATGSEHQPPEPDGTSEIPWDEGWRLTLQRNGWIQSIDAKGLLAALPEGCSVRLDTSVGRYAIDGTPLCTVWPPPPTDGRPELVKLANRAVRTGPTRTLDQDVPYGIRQLVDVALRALSPSSNDPTTAQDAIFHLVAVLNRLLDGEPAGLHHHDDNGRRLIAAEAVTVSGLVDLAFDELRVAAAPYPTVCIYLLEALHLLIDGQDLPADVSDRIRLQAGWVVEGCERTDVLASDLQRVRTAHADRFGTAT